MSDTQVIVVENEGPDEAEEAAEEVEEAVEEVADAIDDAAQDAVNLQLVERVTRLEDALVVQSQAMEQLQEQISGLNLREDVQDMVDQAQQEQINDVAEETDEAVEEVAEEAADAVEETVEDIQKASESESEEGSEITPDEVPTVKEHPFFRKWGKK